MIYPNILGIKEQYAYTLEEVLSVVIGETGGGTYPPLTELGIQEVLSVLGYLDNNHLELNPYSLSFLYLKEVATDIFALEPTELAMAFFNKLDSRYRKHYAFVSNNHFTNTQDAEYIAVCNDFIRKVINKLDYTYDKYSTLLSYYGEEKSHLLDRLSRSRSGTRDVSQEGEHEDLTNTTNIFNDTPQTSDVVATIEGNQYVSELNKSRVGSEGSSSSSGSDEFEENELFDTMTIMQKLDEVQKLYAKTWENWINEFDELFIEEVNY